MQLCSGDRGPRRIVDLNWRALAAAQPGHALEGDGRTSGGLKSGGAEIRGDDFAVAARIMLDPGVYRAVIVAPGSMKLPGQVAASPPIVAVTIASSEYVFEITTEIATVSPTVTYGSEARFGVS